MALVSGGEDCRYKVWDSFGRQLYQSQPHVHVVTAVRWSPNGLYFAVGAYDLLKLCDRTGWSCSRESPRSGSIMDICWTADGTQLVGAPAVKALSLTFDGDFDTIALRRVEAAARRGDDIVHVDPAEDLARQVDPVSFALCHPVKRAAPGTIDARQAEHPRLHFEPPRVAMRPGSSPPSSGWRCFVDPSAAAGRGRLWRGRSKTSAR